MLLELLTPKFIILYIFIITVWHSNVRGKERFKFNKQLQAALLAPVNSVMYLCSAVPNKPYIDLSRFPELDVLQENWEEIREEALNLLKQGDLCDRKGDDDAGFHTFLRRGWRRFYINWYGHQHPSAQALCPKTTALVSNIKNVKMAMFTFLPAGGKLNKHRDPYAGSLRYHLGLITPNSDDCAIWVDGEKYAWRDGECVLFDETFIHHAKNDTDQDRLILMCDVMRPLRYRLADGFNQFISRTIMAAASSPNKETDKTGFINKVFKYINVIKNACGKLKAKNKRAYYIGRAVLVVTAVYFIFIRPLLASF